MTKITDWANCYDLGWKGLITDEAFSHPAKYSRALIFKIIEYALQDGLIQPGQTIVDPFGGVALGALPSLMNGLNWVGCELEARFVELGRKNIDLWNAKFSSMPKWVGTAQLLQGDSRRLAEVIAGAGLVVSSPPYAESLRGDNKPDYAPEELERAKANGQSAKRSTWGVTNSAGVLTGKGYGSTNGNLGNLPPGSLSAVISSPPFAGNTGGRGEASRNGIDAALFDRHSGGMKKGTGSDPANLDHLPMGQVSAVIASPPYAESLERPNGIDASKIKRLGGSNSQSVTDPRYGSSSGQLGAMVVGSPPFEKQNSGGGLSKLMRGEKTEYQDLTGRQRQNEKSLPGYMLQGDTPGQVANESGETFWAASRTILTQCYEILPGNAAAIWVLKAYIKNGKVVDFPGQWQALCEACGFETVEIIRAWLVKRNGAQGTIEGGTVSKDVARKSFFRRLAEKNGSPPIDYETVLVTRKKGA